MRKLYIYGCVLNNAAYIEGCINSIEKLQPELIVVKDNGSTDGTISKLRAMDNKYHNIVIIEGKWETRGKARQMALDYVITKADIKDLAMYIDFDDIYTDYYISKMKSRIKTIKDYQVSFSMLSTIKTNKIIKWKNLHCGEDWERMAHFYSIGVKIIDIVEKEDAGLYTIRRMSSASAIAREKFYTKSPIRLFKNLIDEHRAIAYKQWRGNAKHTSSILASYVAHLIAIIRIVYSYSRKLDNRELVMQEFRNKSKN